MTTTGALVSVVVGSIFASVFVADQLMGPAAGTKVFPWFHANLTLNYTYRGLCLHHCTLRRVEFQEEN